MDPGRARFAARFDVSRETLGKLDRYAALLVDWQTRMNLVGPSTLPQVWERHFADSAQLAALAPANATQRWLDIGAGGGFPGIVLAILGAGRIEMVESIAKKCLFLRTVISDLALDHVAIVHHARVESLSRFPADVITARAAADLTRLFDWGGRFASSATLWLLPKGATVGDEIAAASARFVFDHDLQPSITDARGRIVVARGVKRR